MTMTTKDLIAILNTLRTKAGMKPLKAWKESRAKLEAAIDTLSKKLADEAPHTVVKPDMAKGAYDSRKQLKEKTHIDTADKEDASVDSNGLESLVKFLQGWAKNKVVIKTSDTLESGNAFYSCGKWLTRLPVTMVADMIREGHAQGTINRFGMMHVEKPKREKKERAEKSTSDTPSSEVAKIAAKYDLVPRALRQALRRLDAAKKLPFKKEGKHWALDEAGLKFVDDLAKDMAK